MKCECNAVTVTIPGAIPFFSSSTACIWLAFFYFLVVILMLPLDPHVIIRVGLLRHDLLLFMAHAVVYIMTVSCS